MSLLVDGCPLRAPREARFHGVQCCRLLLELESLGLKLLDEPRRVLNQDLPFLGR
jgi:hypothetical protein